MSATRERMVYINGELVPESQAVVSVFDRGFQSGDGVYDVERTYGGKPFKLRRHLERLYNSLHYTRIDPGLTIEQMERATLEVVEANAPLLAENEEYAIRQTVSRGLAMPVQGAKSGASVVIYCTLIEFRSFAKFYLQGLKLVTPATRRTPSQSLSPKAKITNKMNHHISEFEAKLADPEAYPLMLDLDGNIAESSAANFLFVSKGVIRVPDRKNALGGITMETVLGLADGLGIPWEEGDYAPFDVYNADEAFLTGTSRALLPVASLNGLTIGKDCPGPLTLRLQQVWSDMTGIDFVAQALSHLTPEERPASASEGG